VGPRTGVDAMDKRKLPAKVAWIINLYTWVLLTQVLAKGAQLSATTMGLWLSTIFSA